MEGTRELVPASGVPAAVGSVGELAPAWAVVIGAFVATLDSPRTRREYARNLRGALAVLGGPADVTPVALAAYRARVVDQVGRLSVSTVNIHLSALRSFLKFCSRVGALGIPEALIGLTLKGLKARVRKPYQVLGADEAERLLAAASVSPRDHLFIALALATGLRCAELCAIRLGDLSLDGEGDVLLRVVRGKGNRDRILPLARRIRPELDAYLAGMGLALGRTGDAGHYLFQSRNGRGRLSTARTRQMLAEYLAAAGITGKHISVHSLRHTAAITWLRAGASTLAVQKLLGHANITTTQRYLDHIDLDDLKVAVNRRPVTRVCDLG